MLNKFNKVIKFIEETMKNRRAKLAVGRKSLAEMKIKRYIPIITICDSDDVTQSHT